MLRIGAPSAIQDKTFNNLKASRFSANDVYSQQITKICGDRTESVEVFGTLEALQAENKILKAQIAALLTRVQSIETRVNDIVVE